MTASPNGSGSNRSLARSEGSQSPTPLEGERGIGRGGSNGTASDDANFGRGLHTGGEEAELRELSGRLRWTERERQHLLRKVEWMERIAQDSKTLLENDRVRRENHSLHRQVDALMEDCARWRNSYENALHYLAVLQPNLAEIAEDDHYRIWKASL